MKPSCPQTLVVCPLCKTLHHGACNRSYFERMVRNRFYRGRGGRHWLRSAGAGIGPIHNATAPQGSVTTPGVCDAEGPAVGTAHGTANPVTAVNTFTPSGSPSCQMNAGLSVADSTDEAVGGVTAGETAQLQHPTTPSVPVTAGSKVAEGASI